MTKIGDFNSEKCSKTVNQCRNFCCVLAKIFSTQHTTQKSRKSCVYTHVYEKSEPWFFFQRQNGKTSYFITEYLGFANVWLVDFLRFIFFRKKR